MSEWTQPARAARSRRNKRKPRTATPLSTRYVGAQSAEAPQYMRCASPSLPHERDDIPSLAFAHARDGGVGQNLFVAVLQVASLETCAINRLGSVIAVHGA